MKVKIIFLLFLVSGNVGNVVSVDLSDLIANASIAIAEYFSVSCVYFINNYRQTGDTMTRKLAKTISNEFGKSFQFFNLSSYNGILEQNNSNQCHVSLRIILQLNHTKITNEFKKFNQIYEHHSDKMRSGAWLIFIKSFEDTFITSFFENIEVPFDIELLVAYVKEKKVHFKEVYQVASTFPIRLPYFGNWSSGLGLVSTDKPCRYYRRSDLEGLALNVGYVDGNEPYIIYRNGSITGFYADIWKTLEGSLNISSNFIRVKYKRHKYANKDSWLYLMMEILNGTVDVGLSDFYVTSKRHKSFDFSYPLFANKLFALAMIPRIKINILKDITYKKSLYSAMTSSVVKHKHSQSKISILFFPIFENEVLSHTLLLPFDNEIWVAVFIWVIANSLTIYWASNMCRKLEKEKEIMIKLSMSFFITFGGLCGQGAPQSPKTSCCRILWILNLIIAAILIPSYSASLTRYLSAKPSGVSFRDLKDFYEKGTHTMIVTEGGFEYHLLNLSAQQSINMHEKKLFEKFLKHKPLPKNYKEALEMLCSEKKIAFYTLGSNFNWELNKIGNRKFQEECVLRKTTQNDRMLVMGILYPKKFMLKGLIDHHLRRYQTTGILERLKRKYLSSYLMVKTHHRGAVSLQESTGFFVILFMGLIMSILLAILEVYLKKKRNKLKLIKKRRI